MPPPAARDPDKTRLDLSRWLGSVALPDARDVEVGLRGPAATGFSAETLIFSATWTEDGRPVKRDLVARVKPTSYTLFLDPDFGLQYEVMKALADRTDVPVPKVHWFEEDPSYLGAPFFVMEAVSGDVPADSPPYSVDGWLQAASPSGQARAWSSGVEALAAVHRADWRVLGLTVLDRPGRSAPGLDQQLDYFGDYLEWAAEGRPQPITEAAHEWVRANRPHTEPAPRLCWGDSRIGNQMFDDFEVLANLDWEMATLGNPIQDLAWFMTLDRCFTQGIGVPRLPGFASYEDTAVKWSALTGIPVDPGVLGYYEMFALFRFAVILVRHARLLVLHETLPPDSGLETNNMATMLLAERLGLPSPTTG